MPSDTESVFDLTELNNEVREIRDNAVAASSRLIYVNSSAKMLRWMRQHRPELLTQGFMDAVPAEAPQRLYVEHLKQAPDTPPIHFNDISAHDFIQWILTLRKPDGTKPGISSYNTHRSALVNLFRSYRVTMSTRLESELTNHFKGLKRTAAQSVTGGEGRIKVGKDALGFTFYQAIALELMKSMHRQYLFAHCFLVFCWNLMCRATNLTSVCFSHMEWKDDALGVYFAHMKNDQFGERPRDPRHIYANPLIPQICPILALGMYWLSVPIKEDQRALFTGGNQYDRFRKALLHVLQTETGSTHLESRGMSADDLGTHSLRKGAATFTSSGSTACPPSTAIHLRAGWALGGVQDRYLRYEAAGDQYVGRTVTGLPSSSSQFAILPPFFARRPDNLDSIITRVFPRLPQNLRQVAEFALASVIYHNDFLQANLPSGHRLFSSPLFTTHLLAELKPYVECRTNKPSDTFLATGIPPHVHIINAIGDNFFDKLKEILQQRDLDSGNMTRPALSQILQEFRQSIREDIQAIQPQEHAPMAQHRNNTAVYTWGGNLRRVPQDFDLPRVPCLTAWQFWCCGNPARGYPPFRTLTPTDMPTTNMRKRLSELRFLMKRIEAKCHEVGMWVNAPTIDNANAMYDAASGHVLLDGDRSETGRRRRGGQILWTSMVTMIRNKEKQHRAAEAST